MLDDMRKYVRFGLQALGSEDNPKGGGKRSGGQTIAEQLSGLAAGFLEWSTEARASLLQELKDLIAKQVEEMGVATKKDVAALEQRVERLEGRSRTRGSTAGTKSPTRGSTTGTKSRTSGSSSRTKSKTRASTSTAKSRAAGSRSKASASTSRAKAPTSASTAKRGGRSTRGSR